MKHHGHRVMTGALALLICGCSTSGEPARDAASGDAAQADSASEDERPDASRDGSIDADPPPAECERPNRRYICRGFDCCVGIDFSCTEGERGFDDGCGCGCER